jgi:uncharacterized membrane protein
MGFDMSKHLKWALVASLAFNVLLAGMVIGQCTRPGWHDGPMQIKMRDISPEARKKVRAEMDNMFEQKKDLMPQIKQARRELVTLLSADQFDKAAYHAKLVELQKMQREFYQGMGQSIAKLAETMSKDERVALAAEMERGPPRPPRHKK